MKILLKMMVAVFAVTVSMATAQASVFSNIALKDNYIGPWGANASTTLGQTFTLGSDSELNSFSFLMDDNGTAVSYNALVYAFDGTQATGPELFRYSGSTIGASGDSKETIITGNLFPALYFSNRNNRIPWI